MVKLTVEDIHRIALDYVKMEKPNFTVWVESVKQEGNSWIVEGSISTRGQNFLVEEDFMVQVNYDGKIVGFRVSKPEEGRAVQSGGIFQRVTTRDGLVVTFRTPRLEDASSLQRNCLPLDTLTQVENFLKQDFIEMKKGNKLRIVAEVDGEVIGNVEIHFSRHALSYHIAEMFTLVVNPKYQRKGIATKMIEAALNIARQKKIEIVTNSIEATNIACLNCYIKAGFKEYGRLHRGIVRKGKYNDIVLLKKDL